MDDLGLEDGTQGDGLDVPLVDAGLALDLGAAEGGLGDLVSNDDKRLAGHAVRRVEVESVLGQFASERLAHLHAEARQESVRIQLELNDHVYPPKGE